MNDPSMMDRPYSQSPLYSNHKSGRVCSLLRLRRLMILCIYISVSVCVKDDWILWMNSRRSCRFSPAFMQDISE